MDHIHILYSNDFGISFRWEHDLANHSNNVQLVFRDTGLDLNRKELSFFATQIKAALNRPHPCSDCKLNKACKSLLLQTPAPQISFAMSYHELESAKDLIQGTFFQLELNQLIEE
jgi:hypothetical protein